MAGSSNQFTYQVGVTVIPVGLSLTTQVLPPRGCNGMWVAWQSGGTLALVNGISTLTTAGYVLKTTDILPITGPATFFLSAAGTTSLCGVMFSYSAGFSAQP